MIRNTYSLLGYFSKHFQVRSYSMKINEVVSCLNNLAPTSLAESWDNVGLLVEPYTRRDIKKMLLTNDLTEAVMDEAEELGVNFILSYHPPLFRPIKRITYNAWKERIAARCLEKGIAVYSPHTSYDALKGGVNDWLIEAFGEGLVSPIQASTTFPAFSHKVTIAAADEPEALELREKFASHLDKSQNVTRTNGNCIEILCNENTLPAIVSLDGATAKPLTISKLENVPIVGHGMGRKCKLSRPMSITEAVGRIKAHLGLPYVRLALAHGAKLSSMIQSVAVCAGSGSSVLRGVKADLWLTGEMSHHEVLDATHHRSSVVLTDHSNCERGYLKTLQPRLQDLFDQKIEVIVSMKDRDPLEVV